MSSFVSVVIVNYNGKKWLKGCLGLLSKQSYRNYEVIFVDNASTDDSVAYVRKNFPKVKIIKNRKNYGFAKGNNIGYKHAKGDYVILLNNDTIVEKDYIRNFIKAFVEIPNLGVAQSKIVRMDDPTRLDACGSFWTNTTFLYHYGYGKKASRARYNKPYPVFSVKGASMIIKREVIEKIGFFDEDFWCYYEETDFCHRAWRAGYECWYYPKATIKHAIGATSSRFNYQEIQYHNLKNKLSSFLKNFDNINLISTIIIFSFLNITISLLNVLRGNISYGKSFIYALGWNIEHISTISKKRLSAHKTFISTPSKNFKLTLRNPRISYYYFLFSKLEKYED